MGILDQFGSTLIGGLVSAMLYGITTLQTYVYYMHYCEDTSTMKLVVAAIWIFDTLHVSFMCHMLYYYLITNYGNRMSLEYVVWTFPASVLVNSFVINIAQFFFAHKIYCLCRRKPTRRWLVTTPIVLLVLARFGFAIASSVVMLVNNSVSFAWKTRFYTETPAVSALVLAEVLITVSLCTLLYAGGSHCAGPRTKRLLSTLIIYGITRCLLTLLVAIAEVAVILDSDSIAWAMSLDLVVGKLYANSLLASLNTRQHLRSQVSGSEPEDLPMSNVVFAIPPKLSGDTGSSKDTIRRFDKCEVAATDITTEPVVGRTTALRREVEV